jgi:hypothetical protein
MSAQDSIMKSLQNQVDFLSRQVAKLQRERVEHIELIAKLRYESELAVKALTKNAEANN